ncbi:valine--tRNA ligase [Micromonospora antibiotica]|nr:valine--tRNA ligase [Micromonospora antibiotica]
MKGSVMWWRIMRTPPRRVLGSVKRFLRSPDLIDNETQAAAPWGR